MNYSIISFVVFLLAVDSTFSLQCYVCDRSEITYTYGECENPVPTKCESGFNTCFKLTKARRIASKYSCGSAETGQSSLSYCEDYPDNCILCQEDLCNEPDKKTTQNSLKCYECLNELLKPHDKPHPKVTYTGFGNPCSRDYRAAEIKLRCYAGEKCVIASSDLGSRKYYGCAEDTNNFCDQYEYDNCTFCDTDFCNKFASAMSCYKCYLGDYNETFKDAEPCSNNTVISDCGTDIQSCVTGYDKYGKERYFDCGPVDNKTEYFTRIHGLNHSELCYENKCNDPDNKKCYDCRFGDLGPIMANHIINSTNCSQPTIKACGTGLSCLTLNIAKKNISTWVGALYTCARPSSFEEFCNNRKYIKKCNFCTHDLCNEVEYYGGHNKKCYDCRFGDLSPLMANHSIHSTNCSQPAITVCGPLDFCLSLTIKKNTKLIGAFHTCTAPSSFDEDCEREEIDCQYCEDDLCNKAENYTAITPYRRTSSAEVLKNNSVSLLNLLFIFIIIHAAL